MLEECGHSFEVNDLDKWMEKDWNAKDEAKGILVRRCPRCNIVIGKSRRYGKVLKESIKDVRSVTTKIFGGTKRCWKIVQGIAHTLEKLNPGIVEINFFLRYLSIHIFFHKDNPITSESKKYCRLLPVSIILNIPSNNEVNLVQFLFHFQNVFQMLFTKGGSVFSREPFQYGGLVTRCGKEPYKK